MTLADAITPLCQSFANSWFKFRSTFRILPTRNMAERLPPHLIISYPLVIFYRLFVVLPVVGVLLAIAIILAFGLLVIGGLTILPVWSPFSTLPLRTTFVPMRRMFPPSILPRPRKKILLFFTFSSSRAVVSFLAEYNVWGGILPSPVKSNRFSGASQLYP